MNARNEMWNGYCKDNPEMWDYYGDELETWVEQQVRHRIVARICTTCPEKDSCEEDLAAATRPVSGVVAGQILLGDGQTGPRRRWKKTA